MSSRALFVITFVLVLSLFGMCTAARCDNALAAYPSKLQTEIEGTIHELAPEWIKDFIRELPHGRTNPDLRLSNDADNYAAAYALLQAINDDGAVAFIRSEDEQELAFSRAVRYLRPSIVERVRSCWKSADINDQVKPILWIDAIMRLYPHPEGVEITRADWEAASRNGLRQTKPANALTGDSAGDSDIRRSSLIAYMKFNNALGSLSREETIPDYQLEAYVKLFGIIDILGYWKQAAPSDFARSVLGLSVGWTPASPADFTEEQYQKYLFLTEYVRPYYPLIVTEAPQSTSTSEGPMPTLLSRVLQLCSPEEDKDWKTGN